MYVELLIRSLEHFLRVDLGDEILVVSGESDEGNLPSQLANRIKVPIVNVVDNLEFNFSRRCNIGFFTARNDHVLLLNDDLEFGSDNPFDQLFGLLSLPNVGLVGGLLVFPDYSIQHGGHVFNENRLPSHAFHTGRTLEHGLYDLVIDHEVVGVTGALMFQLKSTWNAVGGFSAKFPLSFNDVDYSLKIRSLGFSVIQANSVTAFHFESTTREPIAEHWETEFLMSRWYDSLGFDGYSSPYGLK
jgi:GT2 family glycosyltransferase